MAPNPAKSAAPDRQRLLLLLGALLALGFLATTFASYYVSRGSLRDSISESELPLVADNVYSEIQRDLIRPVLVSSTMASDTFLRDWVIAGEGDANRITRYLREVKTRFNAFTSFFVSEQSRIYYHADGILKKVSEAEPRDVWYFRVRQMREDYEINVDPDLANADAMTIFINYRVFDYAGKYIGVAGVGLTVNSVQNLIKKYRERFGRDIYFVDKSGKIVLTEAGTAESATLADRAGLRDLAPRLLAGEIQTVQYEIKGAARFLNMRFVPELNWFLCVEKDEMSAIVGITRTLYLNLVICVVVTLLVIAITTVFVNRYQARLEMVATTDGLTGLPNRRAYDILMEQAIKESDRAGIGLSVALIDVDNFKTINDRFGHLVGDDVLRSIAQLLRSSLREADILCRWGGEEFVAVLKGCRKDDALQVGEKIRERVDAAGIASGSEFVRTTVSIGVAERLRSEDLGSMIERADLALLSAKSAGKNRVRVA